MKYFNKTIFQWQFILTIVAILLLLPYTIKAQNAPSRFASGVTINNAQPAGTLVYMKPISNKIWSASAVNIAGTEGALFTQLFYTVIQCPSWSLSLGIGPNIEIVNADRENDPIVTYLNACTGIALNLSPTNDIALHFGFLHITPAHPVLPVKFFALISFPLSP